MTHTVKRTLAMLFVAVFGSALLYNCEPEADSLGEQLFVDGAAEGNVISYPLIAYNVNNNDSIRSDAGRLISQVTGTGTTSSLAVLGAFSEGQFGMQKASFLTQLRMSTDNFNFGTTPKVDSVVLVMKPYVASAADSIITRPLKEENILIGTENVAVSTEIKTYPTDFTFKYGKTKLGTGGSHTLLHINVDEITTFMDSNIDAFRYSNPSVSIGQSLGSGILEGRVTAKTITKKSDNTNVFTSEPGLRIRLNKDFFQTKILDKNGKPELMDAANFTRYFKGIKLSVTDTDGYLLQLSPDNMEIVMYYTNEKNDNGTITRPQSTFKFSLSGNVGNARLGQYEYDRTSSAWGIARNSINPTTGDKKLYLQGMGGPSVRVKIPDQTINDLKTLYVTKKAAIVSARIRIYTDEVVWKNNYKRIDNNFTLLPLTKDEKTNLEVPKDFLTDTSVGFNWIRSYDLDKNPSYYEFTVTKTVKDIVEQAADGTTKENKPLLLNMGKFILSDGTKRLGYRFTERAFATERGVFVGSDENNPEKRIQLKIIYGTKK
ncbi:DUF4270 family protein [Chryseobacterium lathyri]|uniref:DUF4270 domain-containing protein n=1 Tax=Chryseobacterium lathyri TaxID=395933 RepID=A0ABT9SRS3_9FLAO|nr:DUF4270 family protein [Chryseobacterium lathyri]MDP9961948.1 hypothetical protein [Chryseobacterium lathyri]MDQ0065942.1 hypothetical protein [Chryseobacterium lathyri]